MLKDRLLVAAILVPIATVLMWVGGLPYQFAMLLLLGIGAYEYAQMMPALKAHYAEVALPLFVVALVCVNVFTPQYVSLGNAVALISITILFLRRYEKGNATLHSWAFMITGVLYLSILGSYLAAIRTLEAGRTWTFLLLLSVWFADSAAYVAGRTLGKTRLVPRLSPNKTWEGLIGSLVLTTLFGGLWAWVWLQVEPSSPLTLQIGAITGFLVALISPFGDLAMSMLKREVAVKDTGRLMGAHGGVLDRIDSWLFAAPLVYFLVVLSFS